MFIELDHNSFQPNNSANLYIMVLITARAFLSTSKLYPSNSPSFLEQCFDCLPIVLQKPHLRNYPPPIFIQLNYSQYFFLEKLR